MGRKHSVTISESYQETEKIKNIMKMLLTMMIRDGKITNFGDQDHDKDQDQIRSPKNVIFKIKIRSLKCCGLEDHIKIVI